jgi:nicotinamide-nucleotide amidase
VWTCNSYGIPEGTVDEIVKKIVGARAGYGLTVSMGRVNISIRAEGPRRKKVLADLSRRVCAALGDAYMDAEVHQVVARRLMETGTTLAVAESCTGGLISHRLTEVPGISEVLLESLVTYSNESKVKRLGVDPALIERHGAVSEEVARAMALGAARTSGAEVGLAVTGIAGPGGGSERKPVGLCYMAVNGRVESKVFVGDRSHVKDRAAGYALNMLRLWLQNGAEGNGRKEGKAVGVRAGR